MKTRRKSKMQAEAAAADAETASQATAEPETAAPTSSSFNVPVPVDIVDSLSAVLPDVPFSEPTPDVILHVYRLLLEKTSSLDDTTQSLEQAQAEVTRKDVELEQALQDRSTAVSELQEAVDSANKELELTVRQKEELSASQAALKAQIATLSSTQSISTTEAETLRRQAESAAQEKRQLMEIIERLEADSVGQREDISTLRTRLKETRTELSTIQSALVESKSENSTNKFKLEAIQQELELVRRESEQYSQDLTAKVEEFSRFRREKNAELSQTQFVLEDLKQTHAATQATLQALQHAHSVQTNQLNQRNNELHDIQVRLAEQEAAFKSEATNQKRLVELLERRSEDAKKRVDEVEREWDGMIAAAEAREARFKDEADQEKARADALEAKVQQLQTVVERISSGELPLPNPSGNNGFVGLSPTANIAAKLQKSGRTYTEVYADYVRVQEELSRQTQETRRLEDCLAQVCAEIEERAPVLQQQRAEYDRISAEVSQLASELAHAQEERDLYARRAENATQEASTTKTANAVLEGQLSDLGRQIQTLLREIEIRDNPLLAEEDPSISVAEEEAGDVDKLITSRLLLFRNLPELQAQNQKMLAVTRSLAAQVEEKERQQREQMEMEESDALREAQEVILALQQQLESVKLRAESYIRERDMYRRAVAQHQQSAVVSDSLPELNGGPHGKGSDYEKMFNEVRDHYETYRAEMGQDYQNLKADLMDAQREVVKLTTNLAKSNAQIDLLKERHRVSEQSREVQAQENTRLNQSNHKLQSNLERLDEKLRNTLEELVKATSTVDSLRNETANLRAEKEVWNAVKDRLMEDNRSLSKDREHLTNLMQNLQKIQNDVDLLGKNEKLRLEKQVQSLEAQTQELRGQLVREQDNGRLLLNQKDLQLQELQHKIDRSTAEFSSTRESLAVAEANQRHLQTRADDLDRQLKAATEKLAVFERRPSAHSASRALQESGNTQADLELEVADLRGQLALAQVDLQNAQKHVADLQGMSAANEQALEEMNTTYDEYQRSMNDAMQKKEAALQAAEEKLKSLADELKRFSEENAELRTISNKERAEFETTRRELEATIADMSQLAHSQSSDATSTEELIAKHEQNAREWKEKYEGELLRHADAIQSVSQLKREKGELELRVRDAQAGAKTSEEKLRASEESWKAQKEMLEKEMADVRSRHEALNHQNDLLHEQMQQMNQQIQSIRHSAASPSRAGTSEATDDDRFAGLNSIIVHIRREKEILELQLEMNKQENARLKSQAESLKRDLDQTAASLSEERERAASSIASAAQHSELLEKINQLNILRESNATLRAESETQQKRATRLQVEVERLKAEIEPLKERSRIASAELDAQRSRAALLQEESDKWRNRTHEVLQKYDRIDPAEFQSLKDEVTTLREDKVKIESERDLAISESQKAKASAEGYRKNLSAWQERHTQLTEQTKSNLTTLNGKIRDANAERDALRKECEELKQKLEKSSASITGDSSNEQIASLTARIESLTAEKAKLENDLATQRRQLEESFNTEKAALVAAVPSGSGLSPEQDALIATLQAERDKLLAEKESFLASASVDGSNPSGAQETAWADEKAALTKSIEDASALQVALEKRNKKLLDDNKAFFAKIKQYEPELQNLRSQMETAKSAKSPAEVDQIVEERLAAVAAEHQAAIAAAVSAAEEKLRAELATSSATSSSTGIEELKAQHTRELAALEARLAEKYAADVKAAVDQAVAAYTKDGSKTSSEDVEALVKARVAEMEKTQSAEREAAIRTAIEAEVKAKHEEEIKNAIESGRKESQMRAQVKDKQLVKAQARIKELEAQLGTGSPTTKVPAPALPAKPQLAKPTTSAVPGPKPAAATAAAATSSGPGPSNAPTPATAGRGQPLVRGRGRGVARGGGAGRGAVLDAVNNAAAQGMTIQGAAKRGRDEGEAAAEGQNALAKRLKAGTPDGSKPVVLQRNRVAPPDT